MEESGGVRNAATGRVGADGRLHFWWALLLRIALTGLGLYFLWRVRTILATVLVALVLSSAAGALVNFCMRRRVAWLRPHTQRVLATSLVYIVLFASVAWAVQMLLHPFQAEIGKLVQRWPTHQADLMRLADRFQDWYGGLPPELRAFMDEQKGHLSIPSPTTWLTGLANTTVGWASHIVELILVPVLAFYFTLDGKKLRNQFFFLVPEDWLRPTLAIFSEGGAIMRAYIISQFWLAVIAGVVVGVGLKLIGMDYAVILGLFAGITRAIPVIGPLLGGIPIVLLSFVFGAQMGNPYLWVFILIGFTFMHLFESKILMPNFLGHALNLHAVVIIIALLIGGEFFGLLGMFLAAPVAALGRVLLMHYVIRPRQQRRRRGSGGPRLLVTHGGNSGTTAASGSANGGSGGGVRVLRLERTARTGGSATSSAASKPTLSPAEDH